MKKILIFSIFLLSQLLTSNVFAGSDGTLEIKNKTKESASEVKDCFETVNRGIFAFNQGLDKIFFKPVAKGYRYLQNQLDQELVMLLVIYQMLSQCLIIFYKDR